MSLNCKGWGPAKSPLLQMQKNPLGLVPEQSSAQFWGHLQFIRHSLEQDWPLNSWKVLKSRSSFTCIEEKSLGQWQLPTSIMENKYPLKSGQWKKIVGKVVRDLKEGIIVGWICIYHWIEKRRNRIIMMIFEFCLKHKVKW